MSFPSPNQSMAPDFDQATCGAISHELHHAAQPLTVLQGVLELALLSSHTAEEYREIIHHALKQSLRVSGCFDHIRELFRQPPPDPTNFRSKTQPNPESYENQRIECANV